MMSIALSSAAVHDLDDKAYRLSSNATLSEPGPLSVFAPPVAASLQHSDKFCLTRAKASCMRNRHSKVRILTTKPRGRAAAPKDAQGCRSCNHGVCWCSCKEGGYESRHRTPCGRDQLQCGCAASTPQNPRPVCHLSSSRQAYCGLVKQTSNMRRRNSNSAISPMQLASR